MSNINNGINQGIIGDNNRKNKFIIKENLQDEGLNWTKIGAIAGIIAIIVAIIIGWENICKIFQ